MYKRQQYFYIVMITQTPRDARYHKKLISHCTLLRDLYVIYDVHINIPCVNKSRSGAWGI